MWSRTAPRGLVRPSSLVRAGVVGLAVMASAGLGMPAAGAAPATASLVLAPQELHLSLHQDQISGPQPLASVVYDGGLERVPVAHGGTVTFQLPSQLTSAQSPLVVSLELAATQGAAPTLTYSSNSTDPARLLPLADLGAGRYQVALPADDGVNGPLGSLQLAPLTSTVSRAGVSVYDPVAPWALEFTAAAPAAVELTSQLFMQQYCGGHEVLAAQWPLCPTQATVTAGRTLEVTLPADSTLAALGLPDLSRSAFSVERADRLNLPNGWPRQTLEAAVSADARVATVTIPASLAAGHYLLNAGVMDATGRVFATTETAFDVIAAPAAVNPGLRSETGGDDASSALLPVALGSVGALGAAGAVVRSRRAAARA